jgi:serine/threonine-protein kinase RsbW
MTLTGQPAPSGPPPDGSGDAPVVLVVPADSAYLAVLRTASAGLAARLDLDLDEIEDLRIAVDEAGTLLMAGAEQGDRLRAEFRLSEDELDIEVSGPSTELPERSSIAWAVLEALVGGDVVARNGSGGAPSSVRLTHRRRRPRL